LYALTIFQFQLLARIDDRTQVLVENIRVHDSFCNALETRMNWSKNVTEERDAPWQIILGSGVTLTRYFRRMFSAFATTTQFLQVERSQRRQRTICVPRFRMEALLVLKVVVLLRRAWESHSIRKFAATHARCLGYARDDKDICGCWKSKTRLSDVYKDTELPYSDAKVAEK
jgi:hypothetical protein